MKTIIISVLILLNFNCLFSQEFYREQIDIDGGVGIPKKDFALSGSDNINNGNALLGFNFKAMVSYKLTKSIGFTAGYIFNSNPLDAYAIETNVETLVPGFDFTMEKSSYKINSFLAGFLICVPHKDNSFEISGMLGNSRTNKPEINLVGFSASGVVSEIETNSAIKNSICYYFGCNYRIPINDKIGFNTGIGYLYTMPFYNDIYTVKSVQGYLFSESDNCTLKVNIIQITFGLSFN